MGALLLRLGMPLALAISGIIAWRASKREDANEEKPAWRDNSLDDWRKERDAQLEAEREARSGAKKEPAKKD